jgi:hypothetical protein
MQHRTGESRDIAQLGPSVRVVIPLGYGCQHWTQTQQRSGTVPLPGTITSETGWAAGHEFSRIQSRQPGCHRAVCGHCCRAMPSTLPACVPFSLRPPCGTWRRAPTTGAETGSCSSATGARGTVVWSIHFDMGLGWTTTLSGRIQLSNVPSSRQRMPILH